MFGEAQYRKIKANEAKAVRVETEKQRIMNYLASMPAAGSTTTTRAVAQKILLDTDGWMFAQGMSYDIVVKGIGAGVYRISLKKKA